MVYDSCTSPVALSTQVFHRPARLHGSPSARLKFHHWFFPLFQFGSSKDVAGMMQRWPRFHGSLNVALAASSSDRALFVENVSFGVLANHGIRPH
jgi:hypothetical protein